MPIKTKNVIYLSGRMSGLPDFNYPAFNQAADMLRARGYTVENPAENPAPACGSWVGYMRLAITQMMRCDVLISLHGWKKSKGARVERWLARILGFKVISIDDIGG